MVVAPVAQVAQTLVLDPAIKDVPLLAADAQVVQDVVKRAWASA